MDIYSRLGYFEPVRVNHSARSGSKWGQLRDVFSNFYKNKVEAILTSTQNIHFNDKNDVNKISLNICFLELLEEFPRESKPSLNQSR